MKMNSKPTYISLFSSAGIGCYGFKLEGFDCIATNELIARRLEIQNLTTNANMKVDIFVAILRMMQQRVRSIVKSHFGEKMRGFLVSCCNCYTSLSRYVCS